jgi:hypothetical protein
MNTYHWQILCLITTSFVFAANAQETNDWHANTSLLDFNAKHGDPAMREASSSLARDVKVFYQSLRDKQWHKSYVMHAKVYRDIVMEPTYLAETIKYENIWGLVNYDVLSIQFRHTYDSTNINEGILICKFTELPDYAVAYSTVWWHKEEGGWKCLSAGPIKLSAFKEIISPFVDWR